MDKSRHDKASRDGVGVRAGGRLKRRLARILLYFSCATTSATAFVSVAKTNAAPVTSSHREPPPAAGPGSRQPRFKIDGSRQRGRRCGMRALVHISIDYSGVGAFATNNAARRSARSAGPALLRSPMPAKDVMAVKDKTRNRNGDKPRSPSYRYSCSSSTFTDDDELAPFSRQRESGDMAETRSTLFSSLSFSSDSTSDFYTSTRPKRDKKPPRHAPRRPPPRAAKPADAFRTTVTPAQAAKHDKGGKKAGNDGAGVGAASGTAVVKQSRNPYADFRSSMVEMVVERRISGADAMGELLVSYLCLNSPRHHPAILGAFVAVWESVLFDKEP